jgi:hypothetical protein
MSESMSRNPDPAGDFPGFLQTAAVFLSRLYIIVRMLYSCRHDLWRCAMDDLFMLAVVLLLFLLMTGIIELCDWLVRRR